MQAYRFKDDKSDKFWTIDELDSAYVVNYGKTGAIGKFQVKEFDRSEDCEKEVKKLIASKVKKGYRLEPDFDADKLLYFDDAEVGLHPLTSHPRFRACFKDEFYYDCGDEEAPFGSDEGSDTLAELQDYMRKNREVDVYNFPRHIMEDVWGGMRYIPPDSLETGDIKALVAEPDEGIPMSQLVMINDQVIVASAFGQIKIMGAVFERLKAMALRALRRILVVAELEGYGYSEITQKMMEDLERFENPPYPEPTDMARTLMDYLDCECETYNGLLDDDDMIYAYEQALEAGKKEGYTPLLIVVSDTLLEQVCMEIDEDSDMDFDPAKVKAYREKNIKEAITLDPVAVFKDMAGELDDEEAAEAGAVKGGKPINRFSAFWDYDTRLSKEVILAKIPTANPWELPIYVPMGGFNDCPSPAHQAAIMKYWYEKYGATPGLVTYEVWEFILPAPVPDKEEALKLAHEHYYFCCDRVEQYAADYTIGKLAHCLTQSKVWYFWWD